MMFMSDFLTGSRDRSSHSPSSTARVAHARTGEQVCVRDGLGSSLVAHIEEAINPGERESSDADDNTCRHSAPQGVCPSEFPDSKNRRSDGNEEADRGNPKRKRRHPAWVEETARFQASLPLCFAQRLNLHVVRHFVYSHGADRLPRYGYHTGGYAS